MKKILIFSKILVLVFLISCSGAKKETGNLAFVANGEGFVADGFTDKFGWKISFSKVLVNITDIKVEAKDGSKTVSLPGTHLVDFKSSKDATVKIGSVEKVPATEYRSLTWSVKRLDSGEYNGASMVLIGTAEKGDKKIDFVIKFNEEITWNAKEGYSGDKVKGIVKKGETGEVEMTFHWDHVFGDKNAAADTHINKGAVGFKYFEKFAENGKVVVGQDKLSKETDKDDFKKLIKSLHGLGHSGEGHASVVNSTTKL